jgi:hypothetical protein
MSPTKVGLAVMSVAATLAAAEQANVAVLVLVLVRSRRDKADGEPRLRQFCERAMREAWVRGKRIRRWCQRGFVSQGSRRSSEKEGGGRRAERLRRVLW